MADNFIEELERLSELHRSGVLTDDEFSAAKARLIGGDPPRAATPPAEPERAAAPAARVLDLSTATPARTAASLAERDTLLLEELDTEPIAPPTRLGAGPTSVWTITVVVGLVAAVAVILLIVALSSGGDDDGAVRPADQTSSPTTIQEVSDLGGVAPSPVEDLLSVGGVLHVAPIDLPGDGWESGTIDPSMAPDCPTLGTIDATRIQLIIDHATGLAVSIVPTTGASTSPDFAETLATCLDVELDADDPPEAPGAAAAAMLPTARRAVDPLHMAMYVLAGDNDQQWLVSLLGDRTAILAYGDDIMAVVGATLT